ncbi:MAG: hypothetical protein OCD76_20230 [Reichenbachiella sp.]
MKNFKSLLLTFVGLIALSTYASSAILVANNNPGAPTGTNVYATLTSAIANATAGDIIYVIPSSINYGDITVDKSLTLFGAGLIPDKDLGLKTKVDNLYIDASDVRISGIIGTGEWCLGRYITSQTISNITIENCRFPNLRHYSSTVTVGNLLIRNNVLNNYFNLLDLQTTSGVIITNNLFIASNNATYGLAANGVTFSYNIFLYQGTTGTDGKIIENIQTCLFEYNIFYGATPDIPTNSYNNTLNYNVSFGNSVNTFSGQGVNGNSGIGNVIGDPLFTNLSLGTSWDNSFDLTTGAGTADDIDGSGGIAGVTGGLTPWDPDGSLLPTVQTVTIPAVIPLGSDLNVNVTGKGN